MPSDFNPRYQLQRHLQTLGFRSDPRAKNADKFPGLEDRRINWTRTAVRVQRRDADGTWHNSDDPTYFGAIKNDADAEALARYYASIVRGTCLQHTECRQDDKHASACMKKGCRPPVLSADAKRAAQTEKAGVRRQAVDAVKNGPGFYVVNRGSGTSMFSANKLAVNHGPFRTLEEAEGHAWKDLQQFIQMRFDYLLPVMVVKAANRSDASVMGSGPVYWINGKTKGAPPDPRQVSIPGFARGTTKWRDYTGKPARPKKRKRDR